MAIRKQRLARPRNPVDCLMTRLCFDVCVWVLVIDDRWQNGLD